MKSPLILAFSKMILPHKFKDELVNANMKSSTLQNLPRPEKSINRRFWFAAH